MADPVNAFDRPLLHHLVESARPWTDAGRRGAEAARDGPIDTWRAATPTPRDGTSPTGGTVSAQSRILWMLKASTSLFAGSQQCPNHSGCVRPQHSRRNSPGHMGSTRLKTAWWSMERTVIRHSRHSRADKAARNRTSFRSSEPFSREPVRAQLERSSRDQVRVLAGSSPAMRT